jgi:hypothetical protein
MDEESGVNKLKIVVLTPIPRAIEITPTARKPGCFQQALDAVANVLESVCPSPCS